MLAYFCKLASHSSFSKGQNTFWIIAENKFCDQQKRMFFIGFVHHDDLHKHNLYEFCHLNTVARNKDLNVSYTNYTTVVWLQHNNHQTSDNSTLKIGDIVVYINKIRCFFQL